MTSTHVESPPAAPPPATVIERSQPRLFGIAYRMLGDVEDAREVVQEALLRWHEADRSAIVAPEGWLVRVVTRLAIDRRRRAATERAAYVGHWLPEPVATDERAASDRSAELASDLSLAFLLLLERSEVAARQIVHRARTRLRAGRRRFEVPPEVHRRLIARFIEAVAAEDRDTLLELFEENATFISDGGGKVNAARNIVRGSDRITRLLLGLERKYGAWTRHFAAMVNGEAAVLTLHGERVIAVTTLETDGERVVAVYRVLNPDKLRHVG